MTFHQNHSDLSAVPHKNKKKTKLKTNLMSHGTVYYNNRLCFESSSVRVYQSLLVTILVTRPVLVDYGYNASLVIDFFQLECFSAAMSSVLGEKCKTFVAMDSIKKNIISC